MSLFTVRFWGTRGSIPAPGPATQRYGGNTSCVEVRCGKTLIILDAGTGIRELGNALLSESDGKPIQGHILISHTHWDHIQGFPFFVPAYRPGNIFQVHGPHGMGKSFEEVFRGLMDPSYFPVDMGDMESSLKFKEIHQERFELDGVHVQTVMTHHPGVDLAYRFSKGGKSVTYLTDHEVHESGGRTSPSARREEKRIQEFCLGTDLLICDAQYTEAEYKEKRGWGHSRYSDIVRLAMDAQAKRLALFHHDPSHDDKMMDSIVADCQDLIRRAGKPLEVFGAREGMRLEL